MFEMKYDKDGMPIKNQESVEQPSEETQEALQQLDESEQQDESSQEEETQEVDEQSEQSESEEVRAEKSSDKEENFRKLREKTERLEKERDEAIRLAEAYYKKVSPSDDPKKTEEEDADDDTPFSINDDDLVEGKHLNKFQKKILRLENQIKKYEQQTKEATTEAKLKATYSDFDSVVSADNIKKLRDQDPELAEAINNTPDIYKKASLAYKMIKKMGIVKDEYSKDREIAKRNTSKPKPSAVVSPQTGDTPLSKANSFANGLTEDLKKQLRLEMEQSRKGF